MKKHACLIFALLLALPAPAALASESVFGTPMQYGDSSLVSLADASVLPDGGLILVGGSGGPGDSDASRGFLYPYALRVSPENDLVFLLAYRSGREIGSIADVVPLSDGTFIMLAHAFNDSIFSTLLGVGAEGEVIWEKEIDAYRWRLCPTGGDDVFILATHPVTDDPTLEIPSHVKLLNKDGEIRWERNYAEMWDLMWGFTFTGLYPVADGYFFHGTSMGNDDRFGMIGKIDKQGNLLWIEQPSEEAMLEITGILPAEDGGALAIGFDVPDGKVRNQTWRYSASGELLWSRDYAEAGAFRFQTAEAYGGAILVALDTMGGKVSFAILDMEGNLLSKHGYAIDPKDTFAIPKVLVRNDKAYLLFVQRNRFDPAVTGRADIMLLPLLLEEASLQRQ